MPTLEPIQLRRGTAAAWTTANPVLLTGEVGLETDTRKFKVGNGTSAWSALTYWVADGSGTGGTGLDAEGVRDTIGAALLGTGVITVTPNDAGDTITISSSATANSSDAFLTNRVNHTGTQAASTITETSTLKIMTDVERTKLSGIATAATANSTDAYLLDRSHHTGTEDFTTISGLAEYIRDTVAAFVAQGANVTITHNDAGDTLTIASAGAGGTTDHNALSNLTVGDPHTQYQLKTGKGAASGYASLDTGVKVPIAQVPTGTTSSTVSLGNHTHALDNLSDVDTTTTPAASGDTLFWNGTQWVADAISFPTPPTGVDTLDELTDVTAPAPSNGNLLVNNTSTGVWEPRFVGNLVLALDEQVPAGTPPCIVWNLPATLIKDHTIEGTNGATFNALTEGFSVAWTGAAVTYTNAQAAVGTTSIQVVAGNQGYGTDTGLNRAEVYTRTYVRFASSTGNINFQEARTTAASIAALQRDTTTGNVNLKNGSGATVATSTTALALNTWYRIEWHVGNNVQQLRIYSLAGSLLQQTAEVAASAGTVDTIRFGIYTNLNGAMFMDASAISDGWIGA